MPENKQLTVQKLQEKLDAMGVPYNKKAKLEELQALYDENQRPFEVVPGQMVKVMTKDKDGNDIEGEMALDLLMGADEVIIQLKEENAQLKATNVSLYEVNEALEAKNAELEAKQSTIIMGELDEATEDHNLGTGDNIANVSTVIGLESRMRAGFTFTRKTATYYLSDEELAAIKADNHLIIHGEVKKREVE
ncbi:hypothetical protein [Wohlfahrtiimonas larvae]|uniref:SAP domain-containing protein n=1 Tax=Wohlfahrtiimonas larvae TaxID=1157986 RepID=A0ABP9MZW4_9GAMM|nr:hypothetical protein [Wohlfahrtiimonas larvae]